MVAKASACLLAAIAVFCETAWAHFPICVEPKANDGLLPLDFSPVQVGLCPSLQMVHGKADTVVSVGALSLRQNSALASVALENSMANNYLAQAGFIAVSGFNYAFEVGFLSLAGRNIGISAGVFNVESNFGPSKLSKTVSYSTSVSKFLTESIVNFSFSIPTPYIVIGKVLPHTLKIHFQKASIG